MSRLYSIYREHPVVTTDSRTCPEGSIFIALKGESFDGNRFASQALANGCAYAVIDNPVCAVEGDDRYILVDDALVAFKELSREHRRQFAIPVIGITGTNGKTTTKELIAAVLSEKYNVMFTQGNFNNDVGVPKTLLTLDGSHDIAVVEMGASHPGDITKLVEYVEPTCGLITNVGMAHLQGFGSFDGVKATKGELYDFLVAHDGMVFLNAANDNLVEMAERRHVSKIVAYGADCKEVTVSGHVGKCAPFLTFTWHEKGGTDHHVETHLVGAYNIDNMLAAACVGLHFGVSPDAVSHALASYIPGNNRSQLMTTADNHLVVDAYNANPSSMAAALRNFSMMDVPGKMVILGDMRELGEASSAEHQRIADYLATAAFDTVWLVGEEFSVTDCPFTKFRNVEEVLQAVKRQKPKGMYILIKGSNGVRLSQLTSVL